MSGQGSGLLKGRGCLSLYREAKSPHFLSIEIIHLQPEGRAKEEKGEVEVRGREKEKSRERTDK